MCVSVCVCFVHIVKPMTDERQNRPILSAINLAVELDSNFADKIGDFVVRLSSA